MQFRSPRARWFYIGMLLLFATYSFNGSILASIGILGGMLVPAVYSYWNMRGGYTRPPRPIQLQISKFGVGQREGFGKVHILPWAKGIIFELRKPAKTSGRIGCFTESDAGYMSKRYCNFEPDITAEQWSTLENWLRQQAMMVGGKVRITDV